MIIDFLKRDFKLGVDNDLCKIILIRPKKYIE